MSSSPVETTDEKELVAAFWERASCGEVYAVGDSLRAALDRQARARYELEPYIHRFAAFHTARDKDVLEIGVGMGADHLEWAKHNPRTLAGIDLTTRAVDFTRQRLAAEHLTSSLSVADAERLPFESNSFDIVYSWGVLHHSPDTPQAIAEVRRVLRPGGRAAVMVYHTRAIVGYLLWARYALLRGRPLTSLAEIYARYLESPGTKAYDIAEARQLFGNFEDASFSVELSCGDLLEGAAGARHQGAFLAVARKLWPRRLVRRLFRSHGLFLLIDATKAA